MASTWPDTTVETPNGARTTFTLTSGLTPVNPMVMVGGPTGELNVSPTQFSFSGSTLTLLFAPATGEIVSVYFIATGVSTGTPGVTTLSAVRTSVRQRADMVSSLFVTDAELNGYINSSYYELYDLLVQKYGDDYFVADPYTFTTDGTNDRYALPAQFFKGLGVEVQEGSDWITVLPFSLIERNRYTTAQASYGTRSNMRYRFRGNYLWLTPLPQSGQSMRVLYIPRLSLLVGDADALDGVSGWEEYIVVDCVIKALQKEESDVSVPMLQKQQLIQRIEAAAENRDAGSPSVVADVRGSAWWGVEDEL